VRTISNPPGGVSPSSGVPFTGTSALMGTDSGCSGRFARTRRSDARSLSASPEGRSIRANVGVELKGVRWSCEASRCVGIERGGPWAERDDGKSP